MNETTNCPVCGEAGCLKTPPTKADLFPSPSYNCPRCGKFTLCGTLANGLPNSYLTLRRRAVMSHRLRSKQQRGRGPVLVFENELPAFRLDDPLPTPAEQADILILWIGDQQPSPGEYAKLPGSELSAWIGAAITPNDPSSTLTWLLSQDVVKCLLEGAGDGQLEFLRLNMAGWQRYKALKHAEVNSDTAFMAMQFDDAELNRVVNDCFKPAVKAADFELRPLTDGQPAGLIDDQLRVALLTARFVIADLTHGNKGAYWEAGFAEGLGLPVIYTCRKKEWDEGKSHFDTSHLKTIIWDPENLDDAAKHLTVTIRATLPAEAKMTD